MAFKSKFGDDPFISILFSDAHFNSEFERMGFFQNLYESKHSTSNKFPIFSEIDQPSVKGSSSNPFCGFQSTCIDPFLAYQNGPPPNLVEYLQTNNELSISVANVSPQKIGRKKKIGAQKKRPIKSRAKMSNATKGPWNPREDWILQNLVREHGVNKWARIARMLEGRSGKQCRERWRNHLKPNIKKGPFTEEEDLILIEAHKIVGGSWAKMAEMLPERTENTIKNHWNATLRKKDKRGGEDVKQSPLRDYIKSLASSSTNNANN